MPLVETSRRSDVESGQARIRAKICSFKTNKGVNFVESYHNLLATRLGYDTTNGADRLKNGRTRKFGRYNLPIHDTQQKNEVVECHVEAK